MQLYGKSRWQEWLARYLLQVVFIIGEVSDGGMNGIDIEAIARDTIREIGYSDYRFGFDADTVAVKYFRNRDYFGRGNSEIDR